MLRIDRRASKTDMKVPIALKEGLGLNKVVLIHEENFNATVSNDQRLKILMLLAKGVSKASELAKNIGIGRTAIYRHLNYLQSYGWITKENENYYLTSNVYLVYRIVSSESNIALEILEHKGAFIDNIYGMITIIEDKDIINKCWKCVLVDLCLATTSSIAKRVRIKFDETSLPAIRVIELLAKGVKKDIHNLMKKGFIVLRK